MHFMFTEVGAMSIQGIWHKRIMFSLLFVVLWFSSLRETTANISHEDQRLSDAQLRLETFVEELGGEPLSFFEDDNPVLYRKKRDLREIINGENMTFPSDIVRRTREALLGIYEVTTQLKYAIENPPVNGTTTEPPSATEPAYPNTTQSVENSTTPGSNVSDVTTTTTTTTTTTRPPTFPPAVNTTSTATPQTSGNDTNVPVTELPSAGGSTLPPLMTRDPVESSNGSVSSLVTRLGSKNMEILGKGFFLEVSRQGREEEQSDKKTRYTASEIIVALRIALNASERVMMDRLSAETAVVLEMSLESLTQINESMPFAYINEEKEKVVSWMRHLLLSVKHSLKKMDDEEKASWLLSKADDITIVITAAFCILAIIFTGALITYSLKSSKEKCGNYKIEKGAKKSNLRSNPGRAQTSSVDQSARDPNSFFSVPSGVNVQTRSNPMYSSHRSVDVERVPTVPPAEKYRNDESRSEGTSRITTERNANGRERKARSPSSNSSVTSFRDQDRKQDRKYDAAKDNEGFLDDDAGGIRTDSESVL